MGIGSTYSVKCPACETMVVGEVDKSALKAGEGVVLCYYCGQTIRLGQPVPFLSLLIDPLKSFPYELAILVILTSVLFPYATERLKIAPQYVIAVLTIPYAVAIYRGVRRFMRNEWGKMGRIRIPK